MRVLLLAAIVCASGLAHAQNGGDFSLEAFHPAMDSRGYVTVNASSMLDKGELSFGLVTDWARRSLDFSTYRIADTVTPTLQAAFGLGFLELGASIPFQIISGTSFAEQGVGDLGLHAKLRLLDGRKHGVGIALAGSAYIPTGYDEQSFMGEGQVVIQPQLIIDDTFGRFRISGNVGFLHRAPHSIVMGTEMVTAGSEVTFGIGGAYALSPEKFEIIGEVFGGAPVGAGTGYQPLETLLGAKVYLGRASYLTIGGGLGLSQGTVTNPEARAFVGIVFEPKPSDRGRGVIPDEFVAQLPKPVPEPEPKPGLDIEDIPDELERCPHDPDIAVQDGCPDYKRAVRTKTGITIVEKIHFATDKADILPDSFDTLDAVADTMLKGTDITLLEVQGHADERGGHQHNQLLTEARAASVMRYLIDKGITASRLVAHGYGETRPLDKGHNEAAWAVNRRVEFVIKQQGP